MTYGVYLARESSGHRAESKPYKFPEGPQVTYRYENITGLPKNNTENHRTKEQDLYIFKKNNFQT